MIKKYLQFINENKDNGSNIKIENVYENREHINHDKLIEILEGFEHNGYEVDIKDGICDSLTKKFMPYEEDSETPLENAYIIPNVEYEYCTRLNISVTANMENNEETEELEYTLGIIYRDLKSKTGFDAFYEMLDNKWVYRYYTLDKIKILSDGNFYNPVRDVGIREIDIFIPTKEIGKIDTDSIIDFYNWDVVRDNEGNVYLELEYETVINFLEESFYKDKLEKEESEFEDDYFNFYDPDVDSIFNNYLNEQNKRLLIDYIVNNLDEDDITVGIDKDEDLYSQFDDRDIIGSLEGTDLSQDINNMYVNMDNMSQASKDYEILHNEFKDVVWEEANGEFLEKEDGSKFFLFGFNQDWFSDWNELRYDLIEYGIIDVLIEYLETLSLRVNPRLSEHGDVDEESFNSEVREIIDNHS